LIANRTFRNIKRRTRHKTINIVEDTLTKKIWLHLHSLVEIIGVRKLQRNNLLRVGQSNYNWSWCPYNMKMNDRNMRRRTNFLLCKRMRLLLWEGTIGSSLWVVGQLGCSANLVEGEVGKTESIWERERGVLMC